MNDSPIPNLESETWRRFGPPSQVRPGVVLATEGQDVPVREALFAANAGQPKALPHHGFKISRPESQGGFRAADNDCRRLLASMLQGRQSSVLLTSRPDTADPVDILLVQQACFAKAGNARFEVHPIEEKHKADHEDDRNQCVILGLAHKQSHV
jgi:hypothetical protein